MPSTKELTSQGQEVEKEQVLEQLDESEQTKNYLHSQRGAKIKYENMKQAKTKISSILECVITNSYSFTKIKNVEVIYQTTNGTKINVAECPLGEENFRMEICLWRQKTSFTKSLHG